MYPMGTKKGHKFTIKERVGNNDQKLIVDRDKKGVIKQIKINDLTCNSNTHVEMSIQCKADKWTPQKSKNNAIQGFPWWKHS